jgi:hypothetical protein
MTRVYALHLGRSTEFRAESRGEIQLEPMCMTSQVLPPRPIGQPLRGSPVLSGEGVRRIVRSYFVSSGLSSVLGLGMHLSVLLSTSKPGRPHGILIVRRDHVLFRRCQDMRSSVSNSRG